MKMNLTVTDKQKKMLYLVLAVLVLIVGFVVFIKPQIEGLNIAKQDLAAKQQEKQEIATKIASKEELEKSIKDAYETAKGFSDFFLPEMENYEVDQYLVPYFTNNQVTVNNLTIEDATEEQLLGYKYELRQVLYTMKNITEINGGTEEQKATEERINNTMADIEDTLAVSHISITIDGSFIQAMQICNDIKDAQKSMIIVGMSGEGGNSEKQTGINDKQKITINMTLYTLEKLPEPEI